MTRDKKKKTMLVLFIERKKELYSNMDRNY